MLALCQKMNICTHTIFQVTGSPLESPNPLQSGGARTTPGTDTHTDKQTTRTSRHL